MQTTGNTQQRFIVSSLLDKAAAQLAYLLSHENVCYYMNYPECYRVFDVNATISYILQSETDKVLASPYFLELSPRGFQMMLEQTTLNVPEIEIWRSALKWAKHRVKSDEGPDLRKELATPLKHIRVCTLSLEDFHQEITPTRVLTDAEVRMVCLSLGAKAVQEELNDVCNTILLRDQYPTSYEGEFICDYAISETVLLETKFSLCTENSGIELIKVSLMGAENPPQESQETYKCEGSLKITRVTGVAPHLSSDVVIQFDFCEYVECGDEMFDVSFHKNGRNILLFPHTSYEILVTFSQPHYAYCYPMGLYSNGYISMNFSFLDDITYENLDDIEVIKTHIAVIAYKTVQL